MKEKELKDVPEMTDEPKEERVAPVSPPAAQMIFELGRAILWLSDANSRFRNAFDSVRFEPEGMDAKRLPFLLLLAAQSVRGAYTFGFENTPARGIFYVPMSLANHPILVELEMERGEDTGGYAAFFHKLP